MSANPLTYQELEAFERKTLTKLSAWEVALVMRLDDAVLAALCGSGPNAPARKSNGDIADPIEAKPDNPDGVKALFRGIAARRAKSTT